jgi:hypothetical protein
MKPTCKHGYKNPLNCVDCQAQPLPGFEQAIAEQEHAAAELSAEQLADKMREPFADVSKKTRAIENESPLFYGVINPTLFNETTAERIGREVGAEMLPDFDQLTTSDLQGCIGAAVSLRGLAGNEAMDAENIALDYIHNAKESQEPAQ